MDNDIRGRYRGYQGRPARRPSQVGRPAVGAKPAPPTQAKKQPAQPSPQSYDPLNEITSIYKNHHERQTQTTPKKKRKSKSSGKGKAFLVVFLILLLLGGIGYGAYWYSTKDSNEVTNNSFLLGGGEKTPPSNTQAQSEQNSVAPQPTTKETIRFVATGDMIAHDSVNANAKSGDTYDYGKLLSGMKPYFDKADISFCNQATPAGGEQFGITGYPVFNAPVAFARGIESIGCNLINIGTNHTNDKGQELVNATAAAWDDRKVLAVTGANRNQAEQDSIEYFEVEGVKFAFMNYMTYNNNPATSYGVNMYSAAFAKQQIEAASKEADLVIVSMRWGTEYSTDINAQQDTIAQELSNFGADVVLGHGTHTLQPVKKVKGSAGNETLVWFGLGNFLNTQLDANTLVGGFAVMDINVADKSISAPRFMPVYMHYEWTAAEKAAQNLLARKNLQMVPLDQAADLLAKSQLNTTVDKETDYVKNVLNKHTPVQIIKSSEF